MLAFIHMHFALPLLLGIFLSVHSSAETLELRMKCPKTSPHHRIPAILLFGGIATGGKSLDLIHTPAPLCLLTFQYPFTPPEKVVLPRDLALLSEAKKGLHDTLSGIHALVEYAKKRDEIDPQKIILVGASFGAPLVSIIAGERQDIAGLILVHGFGDIPGVIKSRMTKRFGAWPASIAARLLWWYADIPSPESRLEKLNGKVKVLLLTPKNDDLLPKSASESLRIALKKSRVEWSEQLMSGAHLRPDQPEMIEALLHESLNWLKEKLNLFSN